MESVCGAGRGRAEGHLSPRSQLTRLSAPLPPQCTIHRQLSQHTHMPCMYSMVRNDIPTYTHTHTQAAAPWPESRTGRHRWSFLGINWMSSCPQITHTYTQLTGKDVLRMPKKSTYRVLEKALKKSFYKSNRSPGFCPRHGFEVHCPLGVLALEQFRECESTRQGSILRRCVCAAGTCD